METPRMSFTDTPLASRTLQFRASEELSFLRSTIAAIGQTISRLELEMPSNTAKTKRDATLRNLLALSTTSLHHQSQLVELLSHMEVQKAGSRESADPFNGWSQSLSPSAPLTWSLDKPRSVKPPGYSTSLYQPSPAVILLEDLPELNSLREAYLKAMYETEFSSPQRTITGRFASIFTRYATSAILIAAFLVGCILGHCLASHWKTVIWPAWMITATGRHSVPMTPSSSISASWTDPC